MKETKRPTIYRTMKYWGKKPHNIWGSYIKKYCPNNGIVLDPFVGSGMTYFEAIRNNRIPITIDINPISDLEIRCLTKRNVDFSKLTNIAKNIINEISEKEYYTNEYIGVCSNCSEKITIYNYKVNGSATISYKCDKCMKVITEDIKKYNDASYKIDKWVPTKKVSEIESISSSFLKKIEEDSISSLWTKRNLKILSEIYDLILKIDDEDIKELLVFAFIQSLHLTSKMCVPRGSQSNRPLSTSWGRPAYMLPSKVFEQNPLLAFEKAVFNNTGIIKAVKSSEEYIGNNIKQYGKHYLGSADKILEKLDKNSVDTIVTDPPYGDLIQYGDLSEVWVSWLEKYKKEYTIDHKEEIIMNKNKDISFYREKLKNTFIKLNDVLKDGGTFILTFNSNKKEDSESLFYSIKNSNFYVQEIIFQKNLRASEANVGAKEGIAISDYYLICKKGNWSNSNIENFLNNWEIDI